MTDRAARHIHPTQEARRIWQMNQPAIKHPTPIKASQSRLDAGDPCMA